MKSTYEKLIEELKSEGKIQSLSGEEHLELMQELNKGMVEFSQEQKRQESKSFFELKNINLY